MGRLDADAHRLEAMRSRPALAEPLGQLARWSDAVAAQRERARRAALVCVGDAAHTIHGLSTRVSALSPEATLRRGYAVVQKAGGAAVRSPEDVSVGEAVSARVAGGRIPMTVSQ
jgi:exodeoxyribonuclease VII large subunit